MGIGFQKSRSCAGCATSAEVALTRFAVPFFETEGRWLCPRCDAEARCDGSRLQDFEVPIALAPRIRWVGVTGDDARFFHRHVAAPDAEVVELAEALLQGALSARPAAPLDEIERRLSRFGGLADLQALAASYALLSTRPDWLGQQPSPSPEQRAAAEFARRACLLASSPRVTSDRDVRLLTLRVSVDCALGRWADAQRRLDDALRQTERRPELRLRPLLLSAALLARDGHNAAVDRALTDAHHAAAQTAAEGTAPDLDAALHEGELMRTLARERWDQALSAVSSYCQRRPDDRPARRSLAILHLKAAERSKRRLSEAGMLAVAAFHEADPDDLDARLLRAASLYRAERHADALQECLQQPGSAALDHLAGLAALRLGDDRALELLARAHRARPDSRSMQNDLWHAVQAGLRAAATADAGTVIERSLQHLDLLQQRFGAHHLRGVVWLLLRELDGDFATQGKLGMTPRELEVDSGSSEIGAVQVYGLLAQRDVARAYQKSNDVRSRGAAPVPVVLLGELLEAARGWTALERQEATWQLRRAWEYLSKRLGGTDRG